MLGTFLNTVILLVILLYLQFNAFAFYIYYVPNGCVNDPLTDKLLTKDQYRENLRVSERAERPSLDFFFAFIRTKTPHLGNV